MKGSVRQRGRDTWQLRVYLGTDADTGRQREATTTVHGSRRHAQQQLKLFAADAGYARLRASTVGDLLDRWFRAASPGWAASTVRETRSIIGCHLRPHLGHLPVAKLTTVDIDDFYGHLLCAGGRDGRPLAPGTVHRVHVVLHRALTQAVRWEWLWLNPASTASPPRVPPAEIRPPSPAEVNGLLDAARARNPALFVFLHLAVTTGARRGQLLALRWHNVDLPRGAIAFTRSLVEGEHGPVLQPTKTHRTHRAALDPDTVAIVAEHHAAALARARTAGVELTRDAYVFSNNPAGAKPWAPNWITKQFIALRTAIGLPRVRLHDLRHFMATEMLAAEVAIPIVAQRLNHARTSTTLNVYAHAVPGGDQHAAATLARILAAARGS